MLFTIISVCKGGGYRYCKTIPPHPKANSKGYYPLHRVLMENKIGRLLREDEQVHHKDENKGNDDIDNLELLTASEHATHHRIKVETIKLVCPNCSANFELKPHAYRLRKNRNKSPLLFCSHPCAYQHAKRRIP